MANGTLLGLSIKLVADLLKTIELQTWSQLALFATISYIEDHNPENLSETEVSYGIYCKTKEVISLWISRKSEVV